MYFAEYHAVRGWDFEEGREFYAKETDHAERITSVAVSRHGYFAVGDSQGWIYVDDGSSRTLGPLFTGHRGAVLSLAFSSDGKRLASGSADGTVLIWDTEGWQIKAAAQSGSRQPAKGEPVNGLMTALAVHPTTWSVGDVIELTCSYKNDSGKPIHVPHWGITIPAMEVTRHVDSRVTTDAVLASDVMKQMQLPQSPGIDKRQLAKEAFVEVLPGQTVSVIRRAVLGKDGQLTIHWPNGTAQTWSLQDGQFRLQAILESRSDEARLAELARDAGIDNVWYGKAASGVVDVTVSGTSRPPSEGQHLDALNELDPDRLDGSWHLARSKTTQEEKGVGTRPDVVIDIDPKVATKLPHEFRERLKERGIAVLTAGYITYKREEQLFAIADRNGQWVLLAFAVEAPHAPAGDGLIKLECAPDKKDDRLLISEGYEDDEPLEVYRRWGGPAPDETDLVEIVVDRTKFGGDPDAKRAVFFNPLTGETSPAREDRKLGYDIWIEPNDPEFKLKYANGQRVLDQFARIKGRGFAHLGEGEEALQDVVAPEDDALVLSTRAALGEGQDDWEQQVLFCKTDTCTALVMFTVVDAGNEVVRFKWKVLTKW
jgi:hypothetical protein